MRVAVANPAADACELLARVVRAAPGLELAWTARDGVAAVSLARADRPDLLLLDLPLSGMDGVAVTRAVMADAPCPVLIVTRSVRGRIGQVYEAMGCGALDAVDLPETDGDAAALLAKITTVARLTGAALPPPPPPAPADRLVLIGASTGGPSALKEVLSGLSADARPAVVVVQHVDPSFAAGLVDWLADFSALPVKLARPDSRPEPGRVLIAATGDHLVMRAGGRLCYTAEPRSAAYRPSVDVFFRSVAAHGPAAGVAVLLTGMGRDGAAGLLELRRRGWHTVAQDEATSVVWGMPRAAAEAGAAAEVLPLGRVAAAVNRACGAG